MWCCRCVLEANKAVKVRTLIQCVPLTGPTFVCKSRIKQQTHDLTGRPFAGILSISQIVEHEKSVIHNRNLRHCLLSFQYIKYYLPKFSKPIVSSTHPFKNVSKTMYSISRPCVNSYVNNDMTAVGPIETSLIVPNTTYK